MRFHPIHDDEPTRILVCDGDVSRYVAEPPALPFPLLRRKSDVNADPHAAFDLVSRVERLSVRA